MNNETRRILDLLSQGKVTVEEAEQLLAAVKNSDAVAASAPAPNTASAAAPPPPGAASTKPEPKWLRVLVTRRPGLAAEWTGIEPRNKDVNVRIPLSLVRAGVKLGAIVPGIAGERVASRLRERGIDLSKLDSVNFQDVFGALGDNAIDVTDGKHQVRIFCE